MPGASSALTSNRSFHKSHACLCAEQLDITYAVIFTLFHQFFQDHCTNSLALEAGQNDHIEDHGVQDKVGHHLARSRPVSPHHKPRRSASCSGWLARLLPGLAWYCWFQPVVMKRSKYSCLSGSCSLKRIAIRISRVATVIRNLTFCSASAGGAHSGKVPARGSGSSRPYFTLLLHTIPANIQEDLLPMTW